MRAWPVAPLVVVVVLAGCGSDPLTEEGAGGAGLDPSAAGAAGAGAEPIECEEGPGYASNPSPVLIETVEATVLDESGAPYADLLVQVCGLDICTNGFTDEAGVTSVSPGERITQPAFKYGDGLGFGKFALPLPENGPTFELGTLRTVRLPEQGSPIAPGQSSTSGAVTLTLDARASVEFDLLIYRTDDEQAFRAAELDLADAPEGLLGDSNVELVFALAPVETEFCPAATLELPNSGGWDSGTEVEFLLHGLDIRERFAPYAGWAPVARGAVDESGERLVMQVGGIRTLGTIGVRRR